MLNVKCNFSCTGEVVRVPLLTYDMQLLNKKEKELLFGRKRLFPDLKMSEQNPCNGATTLGPRACVLQGVSEGAGVVHSGE